LFLLRKIHLETPEYTLIDNGRYAQVRTFSRPSKM